MFNKSILAGLKSRLSLRLLIYVIICSLFFSILTSAYQLYANYQKDLEAVKKKSNLFRKATCRPLPRAPSI